MKYRKLELIFLVVSLIAVLFSIIVSVLQKAQFSEILGQALFVPVLFIALHYGRQPGFLAATGGALIYLIAKAQEFNSLSLSTVDGQFVIGRAALFGLIGIFGSELAIRTKYLIARLSGTEQIDDQTHLYSQNYLQKLITRAFHEYNRHARPFSILFITLDWPGLLDSATREKAVSQIATFIRSNVRLIDEVGYLSDNCFCMVLPDTTSLAAQLVFMRLEKAYKSDDSQLLTATLSERILSMPENEPEIKAMLPDRDIAKFIA